MITFGRALRQAREEFEMTQEELSDETGVAANLISGYERNAMTPLLPNALKLTKYLGFSLDDLRETVIIPNDHHLVRPE